MKPYLSVSIAGNRVDFSAGRTYRPVTILTSNKKSFIKMITYVHPERHFFGLMQRYKLPLQTKIGPSMKWAFCSGPAPPDHRRSPRPRLIGISHDCRPPNPNSLNSRACMRGIGSHYPCYWIPRNPGLIWRLGSFPAWISCHNISRLSWVLEVPITTVLCVLSFH